MFHPENIEKILPLVRKPGRYVGHELNAVIKPWGQTELRFALIFPDLYEIGMSHQGLQILYHILNNRESVLAERCYVPDIDMENKLRGHGFPLFSLESRTPLSGFDVLGITLPYELCYSNILTVLDLAGMPFRFRDRDDSHPLVLGGGSCSMNPEPVADFFDAIVLGDGEEVIVEISDCLLKAKREGVDKVRKLEMLAEIQGVYVPSFFHPVYADAGGGSLQRIEPLRHGYDTVRRRVLAALPETTEAQPLVPNVKPIHDRLGVEIARGCTRGCRFCQAGMIYRPVRERSCADIVNQAVRGIAQTGFDELALLSLSTGDYSCLSELMKQLMDRFARTYVSVSMPSMRVGTLTPDIMEQIRRVRKTGFTVAPEAGSERLRQVINKGITEEDLLETCENAFGLGWKLIKFYFMIGLPTETVEDVEAIVELAKKAGNKAKGGRGKIQVNVSVSTFVPKPHTPFQREAQIGLEESRQRIEHLKRILPRGKFKLKWHDPEQSYLEGVFSRGDRNLAKLLEEAWLAGARLDGWSDHFSLEKWRTAAERCGLDLDSYLRYRQKDEPLPWDHLDCGVERTFLEQELENAFTGTYTPDCRVHGCRKCGLCDFKTIRPIIAPPPEREEGKQQPSHEHNVTDPEQHRSNTGQVPVYKYRVYYSRLGDGRFLGHLEMLQLIFRAIKRAGIEVLFSRGFNPSPKISFSPALPVGVESEAEYFDMELDRKLVDREEAAVSLGRQFPDFVTVHRIEAAPVAIAPVTIATYEASLREPLTSTQLAAIEHFLEAERFPVERVRKGKEQELDIRPLVASLSHEGGQTLFFELKTIAGTAGVGARDILKHVLGMGEEESLVANLRKTAVRDSGSLV